MQPNSPGLAALLLGRHLRDEHPEVALRHVGEDVRSRRLSESSLEHEEAEAAKTHHAVKALETAWSAREHEFHAEIRAREKKKEEIEQRIQDLENAKFDPYKRIGRVLADNQIAPLNQPEALRKVHTLRFRIAELQQKIADSEAATGQEDKSLLQTSLLLCLGIGVAVVVILVTALT